MQPRPGKELAEGFVEHTEFFFPNLSEAERVLTQRGVNFIRQKNPGHEWVNVIIDDSGREIKFNDKPLAAVVATEHEHGLLRRVDVG
jgi:hypothetical protein